MALLAKANVSFWQLDPHGDGHRQLFSIPTEAASEQGDSEGLGIDEPEWEASVAWGLGASAHLVAISTSNGWQSGWHSRTALQIVELPAGAAHSQVEYSKQFCIQNVFDGHAF